MLTRTIAVTSLSALGVSHLMSIFNTTAKVILFKCVRSYSSSAQHPLMVTHLTVKSNVLRMSCKFDHANHDNFSPLSSCTLTQLFSIYTKSFPLLHMPVFSAKNVHPKMTCMIPSLILFKSLFKCHPSSEVSPDHLL